MQRALAAYPIGVPCLCTSFLGGLGGCMVNPPTGVWGQTPP